MHFEFCDLIKEIKYKKDGDLLELAILSSKRDKEIPDVEVEVKFNKKGLNFILTLLDLEKVILLPYTKTIFNSLNSLFLLKNNILKTTLNGLFILKLLYSLKPILGTKYTKQLLIHILFMVEVKNINHIFTKYYDYYDNPKNHVLEKLDIHSLSYDNVDFLFNKKLYNLLNKLSIKPQISNITFLPPYINFTDTLKVEIIKNKYQDNIVPFFIKGNSFSSQLSKLNYINSNPTLYIDLNNLALSKKDIFLLNHFIINLNLGLGQKLLQDNKKYDIVSNIKLFTKEIEDNLTFVKIKSININYYSKLIEINCLSDISYVNEIKDFIMKNGYGKIEFDFHGGKKSDTIKFSIKKKLEK